MLHRIAVAVVALCLTPPARAGLEIWDTGKASAEPLALSALESKAGWTKAAESGPIRGDAVLSNGRMTVVIRKSGAAELYSPAAARARVILEGADGEAVSSLDKITVTETANGAVAIQIVGPAKGGTATATLQLKKGNPALEATSWSTPEKSRPPPSRRRARISSSTSAARETPS